MAISELKHVPEPVRRIEVFTGQGCRRTWTAADKLAIVAESYDPGASVCGVARRHGLTPPQLFTWRREARKRLAAETPRDFVPAVVVAPEPAAARAPESRPKRRAPRRPHGCDRAGGLGRDREDRRRRFAEDDRGGDRRLEGRAP